TSYTASRLQVWFVDRSTPQSQFARKGAHMPKNLWYGALGPLDAASVGGASVPGRPPPAVTDDLQTCVYRSRASATETKLALAERCCQPAGQYRSIRMSLGATYVNGVRICKTSADSA